MSGTPSSADPATSATRREGVLLGIFPVVETLSETHHGRLISQATGARWVFLMSSVHPSIFLSSTYPDLKNVRAEIIRWLTGYSQKKLEAQLDKRTNIEGTSKNSSRQVAANLTR